MEKHDVERLNLSLQEVLAAWASENGLEYSKEKTSITFDSNHFKLTSGLTFVVAGESFEHKKKVFLHAAQTLNAKSYHKLGESDFYNTVIHDGKEYTLISINTRARSYPLIFQVSDGTQIKASLGFYFAAKFDL